MLIKLPLRGVSERKFRSFLVTAYPCSQAKAFFDIIQSFPEHFEVWRYKGSFGLTSYKINWKCSNGVKKPVTSSVLFGIFDHYGYYDLLP